MTFRLDKNFEIVTENKTIELDEVTIVATATTNGKASDFRKRYKTKNITVFEELYFKNVMISDNIFEVIELIEVLKAYASKKITKKGTEYQIGKFSTKIAEKKDVQKLRISIEKLSTHLDRVECSMLAAKLQKVIQKCEVWQS